MPSINKAWQWMVNTCNAPKVGYSQTYRRGQKVNGITYYDCSSMISKSLTVGGFFTENPWFTTASERNYLNGLGFTEMSTNIEWLPGDILWRKGHTEMVYQGRRTMGAHSSSYPLDKQVSINVNDSSPSKWTYLYRYSTGGTGLFDWIKGNRYLSQDEMDNNAVCVWNYLGSSGWELYPVCAVLGNFARESTVNPAIYQNLTVSESGGYGLAQWTPGTIIRNWLTQNGYAIDDGDGQLQWVNATPSQWGTSERVPPYSFAEFKINAKKLSLNQLTYDFMYYWERPGSPALEDRQKYAKHFYGILIGIDPEKPGRNIVDKMPFWFYIL